MATKAFMTPAKESGRYQLLEYCSLLSFPAPSPKKQDKFINKEIKKIKLSSA